MDSLDRRVGLVCDQISDGCLADVVAGNSRHQCCLLLRVAVSKSEGNHVETTGNIPQVPSVHSQEVCDEPAGQRFS